MTREQDLDHLRRALRLAAKGRFRVSPNPMVGAVLVQGDEIVGEGWHRQVGGPHAEVEALERAGERARGATLYVTLEPCSHHGRTPPCADAVVRAGVARVVACHRDPNPQVAGRGFERLREAGIEVEEGFLVDRAVRLNWRFLVCQTEGRPAVSLKWAMSLDGKIATSAGQSQWISSPKGRRWGLLQREDHDAILVGSGTALEDDPRLDRRLGRAAGPNVRVVLDRRLRLPPTAKLLAIDGETLVYTQTRDMARIDALEERGAVVVVLPRVEPAEVLADLHGRGVQSLLVEGGAVIGGADAPGPLGGEGFARLDEAPRLDALRTVRRGRDLIVIGFREGCLPGLSATLAT